MADIRKVARLVLGMGAMASAQSPIYEWMAPSVRLLPNPGMRRHKRYNTQEDDRAFAKKVEKRRKKNRNKKTHRR